MLAIHDLKRQQEPLRPEIERALATVVASGRYVLGEQVERFEAEFARYCAVAHAVGVGNGTDALELALRAVGVGPGDRVLAVANAGGYAGAAIAACGARAVYLDVDPDSMLLQPDAVAAALDSPPKALVVTHLYGRLAPAAALARLARAAGVAVIEDCAQAHGARREGICAGGFGDLGCYSFYPTKNLGALGDGGAVVTNDAGLAQRVRRLRQYGWEGKYHVAEAGGRNSRLDELQAAVLRVKLRDLEAGNARRREIARRYGDTMRNPAIVVPRRGAEDDVVHLFVVRCATREALRAHLAARGIGTDVHYPVPDHLQPVAGGEHSGLRLPHTERLAREILTLPCHPALSDEEVARVADACNDFRA